MSPVNRFTTDPRVVIAVLTYRRPADLEELLPELLDQAGMVLAPVEIIVIDNDPDAGARTLVTDTSWLEVGEPATRPTPIRYVHEPAPGIASTAFVRRL